MSNSNHRLPTIALLCFAASLSQQVISIAQEPEGRGTLELSEGRGGRGSSRSNQQPTFLNPQSGERSELAQFGRQDGSAELSVEPATGQPSEMVAFTVWDVTIAEPSAPETDELVGKLIDKATSLPTVVGTADEVRDLIGRLKAASLLRKSREFRLLTTDGQTASTQSGSDRPSVIATQVSPMGAGRGGRSRPNVELQATNPAPAPSEPPVPEQIVSNSIQMRAVGTQVQLTPRIDSAGGIMVQFNYNSSDLERSPNVTLSEIPGRKPVMADSTTTCQIQSTLRLKSGTAVVVQSDTMRSVDGETPSGRTQLVILAASVQPVLE
jgi:hypothetical protein